MSKKKQARPLTKAEKVALERLYKNIVKIIKKNSKTTKKLQEARRVDRRGLDRPMTI